jgi:hypothetical protein
MGRQPLLLLGNVYDDVVLAGSVFPAIAPVRGCTVTAVLLNIEPRLLVITLDDFETAASLPGGSATTLRRLAIELLGLHIVKTLLWAMTRSGTFGK